MKRIVNSVAPIRVCDLGGWTDTWFAEHGTVLNIGVYPYVQCQMVVRESAGGKSSLTINAENYGDRYTIDPNAVVYDRHPLLEAAVVANAAAGVVVGKVGTATTTPEEIAIRLPAAIAAARASRRAS